MALLSGRTFTGFARQPNPIPSSAHLQAPSRCSVYVQPVTIHVAKVLQLCIWWPIAKPSPCGYELLQASAQARGCVQRSSRKAFRTIAKATAQEEYSVGAVPSG